MPDLGAHRSPAVLQGRIQMQSIWQSLITLIRYNEFGSNWPGKFGIKRRFCVHRQNTGRAPSVPPYRGSIAMPTTTDPSTTHLILDKGRFQWYTLCSKICEWVNEFVIVSEWEQQLRHALLRHPDCEKWYEEMKNIVWRCFCIWLLSNLLNCPFSFVFRGKTHLVLSSAQLQIRDSRLGYRAQWVSSKNPFLMWKLSGITFPPDLIFLLVDRSARSPRENTIQ